MFENSKNREELFFKIAVALAACKSPEEQQRFLTRILHHLKKTERDSNPLLSTNDEKEETQIQLVRNDQFRFIRRAKSMDENKLITPKLVENEFELTRDLRDAFREGWNSQMEEKKPK